MSPRRGKKAVSGHFDPAVQKQLNQMALDEDSSVQALLREALNDLFAKRGKPTIA
jgi:predicted transcriptional regulator